jgi:hypothetical protein
MCRDAQVPRSAWMRESGRTNLTLVIPAKAGIQLFILS